MNDLNNNFEKNQNGEKEGLEFNNKIIKLKNEINHIKKKIKGNKESGIKYYLNILKEGNDTRDEGLSWVIAEILNLGKKVLMSYMPQYLDEKCVLYLFLKAHIILKIKYIEKKINEFRELFKKKRIDSKTREKRSTKFESN